MFAGYETRVAVFGYYHVYQIYIDTEFMICQLEYDKIDNGHARRSLQLQLVYNYCHFIVVT